ncbi:MAG: D-alanyl-D-alanine carboxypeptidase DacF [Firmicutes bacterium]|nr:D-alanyl-D-alanine carboxypeptidase DacF [candidate division NPL-UPA2 bacterium]
MLRKTVAVLLVLLLNILTVSTAPAAGFDVAAGTAVLMEASTGQLLFDKDSGTPLPPASITKLMTLLLALEAVEKGQVAWEDPVIASERAWRMGGSEMFLKIGQEVTFGELLTGIAVVSANDACIAVAEHLAGSEEVFVQRMNERAAELGLTNSSFRNSSGIPEPGHRMSARDIAALSRHLLRVHPTVLELYAQREFTFNDIRQFNRNPLLGRFPGADGLKTGWTDEAGYCLVGTAVQNEMRLISVVLNTAGEQERLTATQELLNYGFRNFKLHPAAAAGGPIGEGVPVRDGRKLSAAVISKEEVRVVLPAGREPGELEMLITNPADLQAPLTAGTSAATLEVRLDGATLTTAELVTAEDIARANFFVRLLRTITSLFRNLFS